MIDTLVPALGFVGLISATVLYIAISPHAGKADLKTKFMLALLLLLGVAMLTNTVIAVETLHELDSLK